MDDQLKAQIEALTIPEAGQQFSGDDFRSLTKPGVYVFVRENEILYVGVSHSLLSRASHGSHDQDDKARRECDKVLLYPCRNDECARTLESILIYAMKPKYNRTFHRRAPRNWEHFFPANREMSQRA